MRQRSQMRGEERSERSFSDLDIDNVVERMRTKPGLLNVVMYV